MKYEYPEELNIEEELEINDFELKIDDIDFVIDDNTRLDAFNIMTQTLGYSTLKDFFLCTYSNLFGYINFLKTSCTSYILQSRYLYFIGVYERMPNQIDYSICSGKYNNTDLNLQNKDIPMRLTPNIQNLYGLHLSGIGFRVENEFKNIVKKYFEDLYEVYELGDLDKLNEDVYKNCVDPVPLSKLKILWHPWF